MTNYTKQHASKLKSDNNLPNVLGSYVAVYKDMAELKNDINKYKDLNYSIIFVGTSAYVVKKEDFGANFDLSISSSDKLLVNNKNVTPSLTGVDQKKLVIEGGMSAYLKYSIMSAGKTSPAAVS